MLRAQLFSCAAPSSPCLMTLSSTTANSLLVAPSCRQRSVKQWTHACTPSVAIYMLQRRSLAASSGDRSQRWRPTRTRALSHAHTQHTHKRKGDREQVFELRAFGSRLGGGVRFRGPFLLTVNRKKSNSRARQKRQTRGSHPKNRTHASRTHNRERKPAEQQQQACSLSRGRQEQLLQLQLPAPTCPVLSVAAALAA